MLKPQFLLPLADELVVDNFAGFGGASTGIERAIGRPVNAYGQCWGGFGGLDVLADAPINRPAKPAQKELFA